MIEDDNALSTGESEVVSTEENLDLRSQIKAAVEKQREAVSEEPAAPVTEQPKEATAEEPKPKDDNRDERGRFVSKDKDAAPEVPATVETEAAPSASQSQFSPPIGWSVSAKAAFEELPEAVKEAVAKREEEVSKGFARYSGLKQFADIAEANGRTIGEAVADYAKMEDGLRRDFLGGMDNIARLFGYDPQAVAQAYAARYGVMPSGIGQQQVSQAPQQPSIDPNAITQQAIAEFENRLAERESISEIERFRSDPAHAYFENVREDMAILLQNGKATDLKDAYEKACWANPETRAILLKSQQNTSPNPAQALQKAKAAAKAVTGSPAPGFNPERKEDTSKLSIRDNIKHAIAQQRG